MEPNPSNSKKKFSEKVAQSRRYRISKFSYVDDFVVITIDLNKHIAHIRCE